MTRASLLGALPAALLVAAACGGSGEAEWPNVPDATRLVVQRRGPGPTVNITVIVRVDGESSFIATNLTTGTDVVASLARGRHVLSVSLLREERDGRIGLPKLPRVFETTQSFDLTQKSGVLRLELVANGSLWGYEVRYALDHGLLGRSTPPVEVTWTDADIEALDGLVDEALGRGELDRAMCVAAQRRIATEAKLATDTTVAAKVLAQERIKEALATARACRNPEPRDDSLGADPCANGAALCAPAIQRRDL